jgi:formate/nitrite transporter FocA (FNT family)
MRRRHPILEEAIVASVALAFVATFIALTYWLSTGLSPWPVVVLCEIVAFGWGVILVVVTSPSWNR